MADFPAAYEPEPEPAPTDQVTEPMSLAGFNEYDEEEGEEEGDVDGIVDPLAGMRSNSDDDDGYGSEDAGGSPGSEESWGEAETGADAGDDDWAEVDTSSTRRKQPLDLGAGPADGADDAPPPQSDELLLDADRLAEQDEPVQPQAGGRRRGLVSGGEGGGSGAGSTLFERMANLSRGSGGSDDDEDDDDKDGGSLNIPRFLGRQNNQ